MQQQEQKQRQLTIWTIVPTAAYIVSKWCAQCILQVFHQVPPDNIVFTIRAIHMCLPLMLILFMLVTPSPVHGKCCIMVLLAIVVLFIVCKGCILSKIEKQLSLLSGLSCDVTKCGNSGVHSPLCAHFYIIDIFICLVNETPSAETRLGYSLYIMAFTYIALLFIYWCKFKVV